MSGKKLTKADLKRMEKLSAKIAEDKKKTEIEKQKVLKMKKEVEAEKKKLAGQWKELKNQKKKAAEEKEFRKGVAQKDAKKAANASSAAAKNPSLKKMREELQEMKLKLNAEGKRARQFKQQVDQLTAENKVLQKKLKNLQGRKGKGEDPRIKNLIRENKMLKKQIKLLMIELNKKRRWFQRCIKSFKSSRQKWIKKQEDAFKKKGCIIKYVFLDDVKQIKAYKEDAKNIKGGKGKKKFKNKIKVKARDGGVIVLKDVEIVVLDGDADDDDDDGKGGKGKKKKKGGKKAGDKLDEIDAMIAELEKELEADQMALGGALDDFKDDSDAEFDFDEDIGDLDGDYTAEQLALDAAAEASMDSEDADGDGADVDKGGSAANGGGKGSKGKNGGSTPRSPGGSKRKSGAKSPGSNLLSAANGGGSTDYLSLPVQPSIDAGDQAAMQAQLVYLKKELDDRTDDIEKLKEIVSDPEKYPDPKGEVKNYILQINKRGDELVDKLDKELHADQDDVDQMKSNNDRWQLWLNNLSGAMAKNGALFNQLLNVYEYYLKELKGRVDDLQFVNNTIYTDKSNEAEEKKEDEEETENTEEAPQDADAADNAEDADKEEEEKKEDDGGDEVEGEFGKLKKSVVARHEDVEGQFKDIEEKQDAEAEEEAKEAVNNYGAEDKEKEALDKNTEKVKEIRDNLMSNNSDWRQLIETVSSDFDSAQSEKVKLVSGLSDTKNELKELLDLVVKIPKRKIFEEKEDEKNDDEEPAAGGGDEEENYGGDDGGD